MKLRAASRSNQKIRQKRARCVRRESTRRANNPLANVSINVPRRPRKKVFKKKGKKRNRKPSVSVRLPSDELPEAVRLEYEQRLGTLNFECVARIKKKLVEECCNQLPDNVASVEPEHNMRVPRRMELLQEERNYKLHPRTSLIGNNRPKVGNFSTGDLVWAKMGRWAYWPAMVVIEPFRPHFTYTQKNRAKQVIRYFVQFFGKRLCKGWVRAPAIHKYGEWSELKHGVIREQIRTAKDPRVCVQQLLKKYFTKAWNESVGEANSVMDWSNAKRLRCITYKYVKFGKFVKKR